MGWTTSQPMKNMLFAKNKRPAAKQLQLPSNDKTLCRTFCQTDQSALFLPALNHLREMNKITCLNDLKLVKALNLLL